MKNRSVAARIKEEVGVPLKGHQEGPVLMECSAS